MAGRGFNSDSTNELLDLPELLQAAATELVESAYTHEGFEFFRARSNPMDEVR